MIKILALFFLLVGFALPSFGAISKEQAERDYLALFKKFKMVHDKNPQEGKDELAVLKARYESDRSTDVLDKENEEAGVDAIYKKYGITVNEVYFDDRYREIEMAQNQSGIKY